MTTLPNNREYSWDTGILNSPEETGQK